jgi:dUTP pyrophosphatase
MLKKFVVTSGLGPGEGALPVRVPKRYSDVGYDLCAAENMWIKGSGEMTWVPTGVCIEAQRPMWYMITARSSLTRRGLMVPLGIIDAEYQGELIVPVFNPTMRPVEIMAGEYIAQCIFFEIRRPRIREVADFVPTSRGEKGFGSTDK